MKIKHDLLILVSLIGLNISGCGTASFGTAMDSWIGAPLDELLIAAGVPNGLYTLKDGRVVYTFYNLNCKIVAVTENKIVQSMTSKNCPRIKRVYGDLVRPSYNPPQ